MAIDPYVTSGGKANTRYNALIGLDGPEARAAAQADLTSDPLFQGGLAQDSNALLKSLNARGQSGGGLAQIAGQRVLQENYGNWLDRYASAGRQGFEAAGASAGIKTQRGDNAFGYGATKAGTAVQTGNAISATRGQGINNLINAFGTGLKAYNTFK